MDDDEILAIQAAAAQLESLSPCGENAAANLQSAVVAAVAHGKSIRDVAAAAHLTALEVLDAADAATYAGSASPANEMAH